MSEEPDEAIKALREYAEIPRMPPEFCEALLKEVLRQGFSNTINGPVYMKASQFSWLGSDGSIHFAPTETEQPKPAFPAKIGRIDKIAKY